MSLCRDGQGCCGLLQACIVGFLLGLPCKNNAGVSAFIRSTPAWMLGCEFVGLGGLDLLVFRHFRRFDRSQYLSSCFLNEAETGHKQVCIAVVDLDVVRFMLGST